MEVLQELYDRLDEEDRLLFQTSLFLGIGMEGAKTYRAGDFLIRNLLGIDRASGALAVGAIPEERAVVQFHLRDARRAASDLRALLARYRMESASQPAGALLISCQGRGRHLYGVPGHDSGLFAEHFPGVPLGGFFAAGEIGPVRGMTFVHGYTSVFGIFRAAGA
jgi:small ligand-binding sensory domain FIST